MWGPKFEDKDTNREEELSLLYSDGAFSTYKHVSNKECSAYDDISKRIHQKAIIDEGRVYYPCNIGGRMEASRAYHAMTLINMKNQIHLNVLHTTLTILKCLMSQKI